MPIHIRIAQDMNSICAVHAELKSENLNHICCLWLLAANNKNQLKLQNKIYKRAQKKYLRTTTQNK